MQFNISIIFIKYEVNQAMRYFNTFVLFIVLVYILFNCIQISDKIYKSPFATGMIMAWTVLLFRSSCYQNLIFKSRG